MKENEKRSSFLCWGDEPAFAQRSIGFQNFAKVALNDVTKIYNYILSLS